MTRQRPPRSDDPRRAILDASLSLISEGGIGALSMREVARRAGVTHGAPYHHFEDRAAVLAAIAHEGFGFLERGMRSAVAAAGDPIARFEAAGRAYFEFALAFPAHFRVMFRPELADSGAVPTKDASSTGAFGVLLEVVAACQAAGIAKGLDPKALVLTGWSTAHGLAALWIDGPLIGKAALGDDPAALARTVGATMGRLLASTVRP